MRESVTEADAARAGWVRAATAAALAAMFVCAIVVALATVRTSWHLVFDDAFITYRYAKNLATGHGLTWNVHERPTEGYTERPVTPSPPPLKARLARRYPRAPTKASAKGLRRGSPRTPTGD